MCYHEDIRDTNRSPTTMVDSDVKVAPTMTTTKPGRKNMMYITSWWRS